MCTTFEGVDAELLYKAPELSAAPPGKHIWLEELSDVLPAVEREGRCELVPGITWDGLNPSLH